MGDQPVPVLIEPVKVKLGNQLFVGLFDKLLQFCRKYLSERLFAGSVGFLMTWGNWALVLASLMGLIIAVVYGIRLDSFVLVIWGVGWVMVLLVLQYSAAKFFSAGEIVIQSSASRLSSQAFVDLLALVCLILGLASLSWGVWGYIKVADKNGFWSGLTGFFLCEYLACIALNIQMLNISITPQATAGEEAIGMLTFVMKGILKLTPIAFGSGLIIHTLNFLLSTRRALQDGESLFEFLDQGQYSVYFIMTSASLPFVVFVLFVMYYLFVDLARAILALPGKLDALALRRGDAGVQDHADSTTR
ncbi:MAG: hypothetical protein HYU36_02730 [Planctomycetes bacterium]|nr:hypothetical protein [Planctomycetota bacterium]